MICTVRHHPTDESAEVQRLRYCRMALDYHFFTANQALCSYPHLEALVGENDGAKVMHVADDSPTCLIHCPAGLQVCTSPAMDIAATRPSP